jgi:hypothetical protein
VLRKRIERHWSTAILGRFCRALMKTNSLKGAPCAPDGRLEEQTGKPRLDFWAADSFLRRAPSTTNFSAKENPTAHAPGRAPLSCCRPLGASAWAPAADSCGTFRTFRGR